MNEYLTKPLDKKLLLLMVHQCATTRPVLHPNLARVIDVTPDSEIGNPLDKPIGVPIEKPCLNDITVKINDTPVKTILIREEIIDDQRVAAE